MTMTRDDVIRSTAQHIRRVGQLMVEASAELGRRAVAHDASKWSPEEWPTFEEATPLAGMTYGREEYKATLKRLGPAIKLHKERNSHHPEAHADGIDGMNLMDLVEMLCDWKAASERHNDGDIVRSIDYNRTRFKIDPQLTKILYNSAVEWGWAQRERVEPNEKGSP